MIEIARDGKIVPADNIASGETTALLADALRLVLDAQAEGSALDDEEYQLHGALVRYLESSL
ncbi:hypothetical protein [Oceanicola sp. 22II-s10i]|uniref:hypothetical protein n=1 Tax=Oceanicola sp. 22II-s10i TaxID=1317116 RepID=UPI00112FD650|nr:hypothetical protein [Oceanicola sp. 22II-s10i]